eukprot:CAMPEP_0195531952 /NCGR_PEP_ID=MMETSP0794_2-20130614/36791_1 /TAXON_ID=515487 /ORGANISM="Stephanopyxis turris, Strain CCMP 815" /LENGTH=270 /DNA_ID=CAMNT_0040663953 /DNA_START=101 /DNA_END=910 /DNA_ORIENTATION=+
MRHTPVSHVGLAVFLCSLAQCWLNVGAHMSALCTATHAQRPQTVTFLFGTYHNSPAAGSSVPGAAHIKTPQGQIYDFDFDDFCAIPHDGSSNQYPDPLWPLEANVSYYRYRLKLHCVCSSVLGCGSYDEVTGMCTSTDGDCPLIDPMQTSISCFGQDYNIPSSEGAFSRQLEGHENGNCAYGSACGVDFASWMRTWYVAKLDSIYSGMFETWTTGTDANLDPSSTYLRTYGQHPCTMSETLHNSFPVTVADGNQECQVPPNVNTSSECIP